MIKMRGSNSLSESFDSETNFQSPRKESLTDKVRQKISAAGKIIQGSRPIKVAEPDLTHLTARSQELILRAVETIKKEDSENVMSALDESRDILRDSFEEFKREQDEYRQQLEDISRSKEAALGRRKENAIPISILMRQKREGDALADIRPNSSMNHTYQAHFGALLTTDKNGQQHATDKAAVVKYIRRRERRKRAEENKKNHEISDDVLEKQTAELMEKIEGVDIKLENERQRQNEILRARMNEKKNKTNHIIQANEILDQANEADLARQRFEKAQREKIEARLSAARNQPNRNSMNMIHVQSHINENDEDEENLNDEQIETTKKSLQLLSDNNGYQQKRSTTPIYGDGDIHDKVANVHI